MHDISFAAHGGSTYSALNHQYEPGYHVLFSQDGISLDPYASNIQLQLSLWDSHLTPIDYYYDRPTQTDGLAAADWYDPYQDYTVSILDADGNLLAEVFSTDEYTPIGWD